MAHIDRSPAVGALAGSRTSSAPSTDRASTVETFEAVTWQHYPALVRRLVLVLGGLDDAEDIAQQTYLQAFESWPRFDGRDARAWLYTIALRLAFNQLRSRRRRLSRIGRSEPAAWIDTQDADLHAALRELEPRTRSALLLNAVDGYTQREVAAILGVPEGTVASWISRGRVMLRERLRS